MDWKLILSGFLEAVTVPTRTFEIGDVVLVYRYGTVFLPEYYKAEVVEVAEETYAGWFQRNNLLIVRPLRGLFRRQRVVQYMNVTKLHSRITADVQELERMAKL